MQLPIKTDQTLAERIAGFGFKLVILLFPAAMIYIFFTDGDGCGDKPRDFHFFPIAFGVALGLAIIWSFIDRQQYRYRKLEYSLQVLVRYFLAYIIMQYGAAKLIDMQFPSSIAGLDTRLIDLGPMGLAWAFFGFSYEYEFFIGCSQVIAAILLLYRRTATLGALIMFTIMANVVFVNFSFNVCVKFFSSSYLIMAFYLLLDDARRLANFFIFNRVAEPKVFPELFTGRLGNRLFGIAGVLAFIGVIFYPLFDTYQTKVKFGIGKHKALYGVWSVDSVHASTDTLNTRLNRDSSGWKKFIFEDYDNAYVKSWKNTRGTFRYDLDTARHTLKLKQLFPDSLTVINVQYQLNKDTLILKGTYNKDSVYARMRLQRKYFRR